MKKNVKTLKQLCPSDIKEKDWNTVVDLVTRTISKSLQEGVGVSIQGLLTLELVDKKERVAMNFKAKKKITVPAHKAIKVSTSKKLKDSVKTIN